MSKKIKLEMNKIEIPKELSERSKMGILNAKTEKQKNRKGSRLTSIGIVAGLLVSIGTFAFFNTGSSPNETKSKQATPVVANNSGVKIPAIQLPQGNSKADMIGLIVYHGKIYTQTDTEIDTENAKAIKGEKLGTTKGTIDEWSKQKAYAKEFASNIENADVYSVKGYDQDFRIMAYGESGGKPYAAFYENLNGITIKSGDDVFGKLKMTGNIVAASYRTFTDWDNNLANYRSVANIEILNAFVKELNKAKPFVRGRNSDPISSLNNENFKELTIQLKDGSKVRLKLLKDGYIYYGYMGAYFKMDDALFLRLWSQLQ